jgi:hypothetical protein
MIDHAKNILEVAPASLEDKITTWACDNREVNPKRAPARSGI